MKNIDGHITFTPSTRTLTTSLYKFPNQRTTPPIHSTACHSIHRVAGILGEIMSNITKVTRGISLDKDLIEIADELLPNRSEAAQNGLLEATPKKINTLNEEARKGYLERIKHLLDN